MSSDKTCRICHSSEDNKDLFSPCHCRGSMAYVHRSCLKSWIASSGRQKCEVCGHQWNSRVIVTKIMNYIEGHLIILIVTSTFSAFLLNIIAYLYSFHYNCKNSLNFDLKIDCHFLITLFTINLLIVILFILFYIIILTMFIYDFLRPIKF